MADTTINIFGSSGEAMVGADTINAILASMDSKLTSDDINIETLGDGTVDVDVKNDTYTINLNHTHEGMAKLEIVDEEPSDPAMDTIYALVNDASDPTEIQSLWIAGLEFVGGGGSADDGLPKMVKPKDKSTIQLGENQGSGVSKSVTVQAKNLNYGGSTDGLTIEAIGTDLTLSYGQQTGQSSVTIPQSNGTVNDTVDVVFSGSGRLSDGTLVFKQGNSVLAEVTVTVTVKVVIPTDFLSGKAWEQTGNDVNLVNATGFCVSKQFTIDPTHTIEVCFGFVNDSTNYGCAVANPVLAPDITVSGTAGSCFWANSNIRSFVPGNNQTKLSCTFKESELYSCYIKDTNTNTYIWKGNNVT